MQKDSKTLILFTASYPYVTGAEQNFIEVELQYLAEKFERIILIPQKINQVEKKVHIMPKVEVENEYAHTINNAKKLLFFVRGLFSRLTYLEIFQIPVILFKPSYLKRLIFFTGASEITYHWLIDWIKKKNLKINQTFFYTYWFDYTTTGLSLNKYFNSTIKFISRAHGYDVYEERNNPPYWPSREFTLKHIEYLYPDSEAGKKYLHERYPNFIEKIQTARLGIKDSFITTQPSIDGILRIVSCSRMVPVKRLDLLLRAIHTLAKHNPNQKIHWRHFGNGEMRQILEIMAKDLPSNATVEFPGYTTQLELFDYYKNNPVDVFVNISQSEGTPVAVMEAISCGIPIIATSVGGNTEIVNEQNGILLEQNPSPEEIANSILHFMNNPNGKRQASRQVWKNQYDADKNFSDFANQLAEIFSTN